MDDFERFKILTQKGKTAVENLLHFYNGLNDLLKTLEKNNLKNILITLSLEEIMVHFPKINPNNVECFLKKSGAKTYIENGREHYYLVDILTSFNFMLSSFLVSK